MANGPVTSSDSRKRSSRTASAISNSSAARQVYTANGSNRGTAAAGSSAEDVHQASPQPAIAIDAKYDPHEPAASRASPRNRGSRLAAARAMGAAGAVPMDVRPINCEFIGLQFPAAVSWLSASALNVTLAPHCGSFEHMHGWRMRHMTAVQTLNCVSMMIVRRGLGGRLWSKRWRARNLNGPQPTPVLRPAKLL